MSTPRRHIIAGVVLAGLMIGCSTQSHLTRLTPGEAAGSLPGDATSISGVAVASFHTARIPTEINRMVLDHSFSHFVDGVAAAYGTRQFLVRTVGCDDIDEDTLNITPVAGASSFTREQVTEEHGMVVAKLQLAGPARAPAHCRTDPLDIPAGDAIYWVVAPDTTGHFVSHFIDYNSQREVAVANHPLWGFDKCPARPPGDDRAMPDQDQAEATRYDRIKIEQSVCDHPVPDAGTVTQVSGGPPRKIGDDVDWTVAIACGKSFCYASPPPLSPPPGGGR